MRMDAAVFSMAVQADGQAIQQASAKRRYRAYAEEPRIVWRGPCRWNLRRGLWISVQPGWAPQRGTAINTDFPTHTRKIGAYPPAERIALVQDKPQHPHSSIAV